MKCPHCGIEVRDTTTVCGYCGGKIPQRKGSAPPLSGKDTDIPTKPAPRDSAAKSSGEGEGGEEEEGGLTALLQPGEQVLIGSLNVSVKKFFFHAYLTDKRIFLIDTQEKKLKVTAKDIPLDTIADTAVESSENADPVLVLSTRAADDEVKTMKLVFAGNGLDRSAEVDEWVELLAEQRAPKKSKKAARKVQEPEEPEEGAEAGEEIIELRAPVRAPKPAPVRPEVQAARRSVKGHEKQPPVKRLLHTYEPGPEEEKAPAPAPHRAKAPVPEPEKKPVVRPATYREIPPSREPVAKPVRKIEVQSAMKGALSGAVVPPARQPGEKVAPRPVPLKKPLVEEPEIPVYSEAEPPEEPEVVSGAAPEEEAGGPLFCQNCGKKLPVSANFCPGCGTKIAPPREKPAPRAHEKGERKPEEGTAEKEAPAEQRPARPPVKKAPKGSEITILHKFLRR